MNSFKLTYVLMNDTLSVTYNHADNILEPCSILANLQFFTSKALANI